VYVIPYIGTCWAIGSHNGLTSSTKGVRPPTLLYFKISPPPPMGYMAESHEEKIMKREKSERKGRKGYGKIEI
jgi:hypothetical protein